MKAIVLCGGLGTRLGALTKDLPKPLVEVAGRPFLHYVLDQLALASPEEIVLAVSFQWEKIRDAIGISWRGIKVSYSIEDQPLGTGGAILNAVTQFGLDEALVLNGDTLLTADVGSMVKVAKEKGADIGMMLRKVEDVSRFGAVDLDSAGKVVSFREKGKGGPGLINSGVYYVRAAALAKVGKMAFSFEQDLLNAYLSRLDVYGVCTDAYFIDMGIPEDLERARLELTQHLKVR